MAEGWNQAGLPLEDSGEGAGAGVAGADLTDLDWPELHAVAAHCQRCELCQDRRTVVFGEGDPDARLMLVGEGPGATEDRLGRPFVGRAGQLLDRILGAMGLARPQVYITNVVMCRPPNNRVPSAQEMEACRPYLEAKIRHVAPEVIVCLGSTAARALIDRQARITRLRGTWQEVYGTPCMPTFHPAALLRDESKKREVWEDFQAVGRRLGIM